MPLDHRLPQEVLLESLPPCQPHLAPKRFVIKEPGDLARDQPGRWAHTGGR